MVVLSIVAAVLAAISHSSRLRRLRRHEGPVLPQWPSSVTLAMLLAVVGLVSLRLLLGGILLRRDDPVKVGSVTKSYWSVRHDRARTGSAPS